MTNVVERAQVARSFAKLAGGLLTVERRAGLACSCARSADAKLAEMKRVARAAAEAARHVATRRPERVAEDLPETQDARVTHQAAE